MSDADDRDPLAGPIDDEPDVREETLPGKKVDGDDGAEWLPVPEPAEGDGPLP